jgi:RNA polymerase sigma-70 factor (ECF subfamily)
MTAIASQLILPGASSLLEMAAAGNGEAFASLVRQHQSMVYGIAWNFTRNAAAAEDVAQEAFLQLYRNIGTIASEDHLVFWLRRVTSNLCVDLARRREHRLVPIEAGTEPSVQPAHSDHLFARHVSDLIAAMPPMQRLVVTLRFQEELPVPEIAKLLEIPANTAKSHLRRALAFLRDRIEPRRM